MDDKYKGELDLVKQINELRRQLEIKELRIQQLEEQVADMSDCWNEHHKL